MPAPIGNKNATRNKPWREALEKELTGNKNAHKLRVLARKLIDKAEEGDLQALKEIGDRIDGKPTQQTEISGPEGGDIPVSFSVVYVDPDPEQT